MLSEKCTLPDVHIHCNTVYQTFKNIMILYWCLWLWIWTWEGMVEGNRIYSLPAPCPLSVLMALKQLWCRHVIIVSSGYLLLLLLLFYSLGEEADFHPGSGYLTAAAWSNHLAFLEKSFNFSRSQFPYLPCRNFDVYGSKLVEWSWIP